MNNIKNIYQRAGKCDGQQNLKGVLEAAMVSTSEGVTYDSPNVTMTSEPVKNQVLGNCCVYSPTYFMLKRKQQHFVLELQNPNTEPRKWLISSGTGGKTKRAFKNQ